MRLVTTKSLRPGTILARPIYNSQGIVLLQKNVNLTKKMIDRLINQGITYVYIQDDVTDDLEIESVISEQVRIESVTLIKDTFAELRKVGYMEKSFILDKEEKKLSRIIQNIMKGIQGHDYAISLLADIYLTDDYIFQHSLNVAIYALAIGKELNMSNRELSELGNGAILHDIGKIFIDQKILLKPGNLSNSEFELMKSHTNIGFDYLRKQYNFSTAVAHCAYQHHERLDGSGYPRGIKKDDIHPYAKIIGIADVFDAVTSNRVYRDALLPHEGLEILYAGADRLFDLEMVEAFKRSVAVYPNGLTVELNDGRIGVVVKQNRQLCDRPIIRIIKGIRQQENLPYEIDLASEINVTITDCHVESKQAN